MSRLWGVSLRHRAPLRRAATTGIAAAMLLASPLPASQLPVSSIEFSPTVTAKLHDAYGLDEERVLRTAILEAVARTSARSAVPDGLKVAVTVDDLAPTRPTRKQLADDPAVDPTRSKFIGGAALSGEVRDANQHVLATVTYRYFPPTLGLGAAAFDPWADARLAIDRFAVKLVAACRDLPRKPGI